MSLSLFVSRFHVMLCVELENLNAECEGTHSRECNLDAVAARNVLKVALASKVVVKEGISVCDGGVAARTAEYAVYDDECDFEAMLDMHDECMSHRDMPHGIPTAALQESKLERIVQCAEDGECPVGEMTDMIDGRRDVLRLCVFQAFVRTRTRRSDSGCVPNHH